MRVCLIIASLALSSCGGSNSSAATDAAAEIAVRREFGPNAVIASPVHNDAHGSAVMCGYVATAETNTFPRAAFIWSGERFDVSRWDDPQYAAFDRRARAVCGASWVAPRRVPAVY